METVERSIEAFAGYDFEATADYATYNQRRYAADVFECGTLSRALEMDGHTVIIDVRAGDPGDGPVVAVSGRDVGADVADRAADVSARLIGASADPSDFYRSVEDDPRIGPLVERFRGLGVPQSASPFEALTLAILGQQISNSVAGVIRNLLVDTFGRAVTLDDRTLSTFPSPESLAEAGPDGLRAIKFSGRKAEYVSEIAAATLDGRLDLDGLARATSEEIVDTLLSVRGVGPWTANWLLIRAYGRPDGFPDGDLAVQRMLGEMFSDGRRLSSAEARELSQRWSPYRSFLTTYLFAGARAGWFGEHRFRRSRPSRA